MICSVDVAEGLSQNDVVMTNTFWVGVYPGVTDAMLDYVIDSVGAVINQHAGLPSRS